MLLSNFSKFQWGVSIYESLLACLDGFQIQPAQEGSTWKLASPITRPRIYSTLLACAHAFYYKRNNMHSSGHDALPRGAAGPSVASQLSDRD